MKLLEEDEAYLQAKAYDFTIVPEGEGGCLIIKAYTPAAGKYDKESVDLLICIPKGYNDAKLDNFYVDPPLRLKATGAYPNKADHFEVHSGRQWQRFSRHLPEWRAGIDSLQSFLQIVHRELQDKA